MLSGSTNLTRKEAVEMLSTTFFRKTVAVKVRGDGKGLFLTMVKKRGDDEKFDFRSGITLSLNIGEAGLLARHLDRGSPKEVKLIHKIEEKDAKSFSSEVRVDEDGNHYFHWRLSQGERSVTFPLSLGEAFVINRLLVEVINLMLQEKSNGKEESQDVAADPAPKQENKKGSGKKPTPEREADDFYPEGII